MRRTLTSVALVAFAFSACSDDSGGDGGNAQPYVDALSAEFQDPEEEGDSALSDAEAECAAEGTVNALGADELEDAGITPEQLAAANDPTELDMDISEDQARGAAEALVGCIDSIGVLLAGEDASDEAVACIDENFDEDAFIDALTIEYTGEDDEGAAVDAVFGELGEACADAFGG
jgi:hypothetical protein